MDADIIRYIPCMSKIYYQRQIENIQTKISYTSSTNNHKKLMGFKINLTKSHAKILQI